MYDGLTVSREIPSDTQITTPEVDDQKRDRCPTKTASSPANFLLFACASSFSTGKHKNKPVNQALDSYYSIFSLSISSNKLSCLSCPEFAPFLTEVGFFYGIWGDGANIELGDWLR